MSYYILELLEEKKEGIRIFHLADAFSASVNR
jgi:hypothetical protein